jgi:outer membrane protein OmpA-like peptidoglycan-associated protein
MQLGCMRQHRFSYGEISSTDGCIAVFPLANINGNNQKNTDDLLSEYVALSLQNKGLEATMGPRDVDHLFDLAGVASPVGVNQQQAVKLGKIFAAQAVIYGNFNKIPMGPTNPAAPQAPYLVIADLYLLDISSNSIGWIYSSRLYTDNKSYLDDLGKLSRNITESLLANGHGVELASKSTCWDRSKIVASLNTEIPRVVKSAEPVALSTNSAPKNIETKIEAKKTSTLSAVKLSPASNAMFSKLSTYEALSLSSLFDQRTTIISKNQQNSFKNLSEAMMAMPLSTQFSLEGHVDDSGNSADDFWVSAQQVNKLRDLLIEAAPGLDGRIQISSKGGSTPLVPNLNQKSRSKNRRIIILAGSH